MPRKGKWCRRAARSDVLRCAGGGWQGDLHPLVSLSSLLLPRTFGVFEFSLVSKDFAQGRLPARLLLCLAYMVKVVAAGEGGKETRHYFHIISLQLWAFVCSVVVVVYRNYTSLPV